MRGRTAYPSAEAKRVSLRHPGLDDCEEFLARVRDSAELHHPWVTPPGTRDQFSAYVQRVAGDAFVGFLACRLEDGAIVGYFTLGHIVRDALLSAYLGYAGFTPFAGLGYMTEALQLVVAEAFGTIGLHRVEANIQPGNAASIALVRRCGFQREGFSPAYLRIGGRWCDHERWAIRTEIWSGPGEAPTTAG